MEFLERHPQSHGLADLVLDFALAHPLGEMLELPEFFLLGRMITKSKCMLSTLVHLTLSMNIVVREDVKIYLARLSSKVKLAQTQYQTASSRFRGTPENGVGA